MCVTAYVDFNLFELLTSKLKMKFELSDVQVKGERGKFGRKCADCARDCVCMCTQIHIRRRLALRRDN